MDSVKTDAKWKLVPVEPTEGMIEAYFHACERNGFRAHINASCAWEAMLAASPAGAEVVARVKQLVWDRHIDDDGEISLRAGTTFGSLRVDYRPGTGWSWGYCFDEYYDEEESPCDDEEDGKARAWAHWVERLSSALETTPSTDAVRRQVREVADSLENLAGRLEQTATSRELDIAAGIREDIAVLRALSTPPAGADALNEGE